MWNNRAQPETGDGRPVLSVEIGSICFDARIGRHAILLGCERVQDACLKSSIGKSPLGSQVVISGAFYNDDGVLDLVLLLSCANLGRGQLEASRSMLQCLTLDQQVSKVVSHHPLGAMLRRIDANDGEPVPTDSGHTRRDDPTRLL